MGIEAVPTHAPTRAALRGALTSAILSDDALFKSWLNRASASSVLFQVAIEEDDFEERILLYGRASAKAPTGKISGTLDEDEIDGN